MSDDTTTDIRTRLIDALEAHFFHGAPNAGAVIDALLSLPDIAIVELTRSAEKMQP